MKKVSTVFLLLNRNFIAGKDDEAVDHGIHRMWEVACLHFKFLAGCTGWYRPTLPPSFSLPIPILALQCYCDSRYVPLGTELLRRRTCPPLDGQPGPLRRWGRNQRPCSAPQAGAPPEISTWSNRRHLEIFPFLLESIDIGSFSPIQCEIKCFILISL